MRSLNPHRRSKRSSATIIMGIAAVLAVGVLLTPSQASPSSRHPVLVGRAVLPALTFAGRPASGAFVVPGPGTVNGVTFPLPAQPVEGFSAIVDGREPGEFLAMPDNGFGAKANSRDFLIRAYYIRPQFKTAHGGDGAVDGRRLHLLPGPRPPDRLPDRERGHGQSPPHRRRHRSRVAPARTRRRPVGGRRVRPVDPALRARPGCCSTRRSRCRTGSCRRTTRS